MFKEQLNKIIHHLDGVQACLLLDADAIPIEEIYVRDNADTITALAVELANLVASFRKRGVFSEDVGAMRELSLQTELTLMLCHAVGDEFLLLVAFDADADPIRGQSMLRIVAPWLERIL